MVNDNLILCLRKIWPKLRQGPGKVLHTISLLTEGFKENGIYNEPEISDFQRERCCPSVQSAEDIFY